MRNKTILPSRRVLLILLIGLVAAGAVLLSQKSETGGLPSATAHQSQPDNQPRQLVRVWVHSDAIYPDVVRARPGKIFLRVENETQSEVTLVVERINPGLSPQLLARLATAGKVKRVGEEFNLGPGEYFFYEESQPQYRGRLIVEAR